jgi:hypothetical protein
MLDELDLIDEDDQIAHLIQLNPDDGKPYDPELRLSTFNLFKILFFQVFDKTLPDVFKFDPEFEKGEEEYEEIRKEIIGDADDEEEGGGEVEDGDEDLDEEKKKPAESE